MADITFGTPINISSKAAYVSTIYITDNIFVTAYRDSNNSGYGTIIVGNINTGNLGTHIVFASSSVINISIDKFPDNRILIVFTVGSSTFSICGIVDTVSLSVTFGNFVTVDSTILVRYDIVSDTKIIYCFSDSGDGYKVKVGYQTASGTVLNNPVTTTSSFISVYDVILFTKISDDNYQIIWQDYTGLSTPGNILIAHCNTSSTPIFSSPIIYISWSGLGLGLKSAVYIEDNKIAVFYSNAISLSLINHIITWSGTIPDISNTRNTITTNNTADQFAILSNNSVILGYSNITLNKTIINQYSVGVSSLTLDNTQEYSSSRSYYLSLTTITGGINIILTYSDGSASPAYVVFGQGGDVILVIDSNLEYTIDYTLEQLNSLNFTTAMSYEYNILNNIYSNIVIDSNLEYTIDYILFFNIDKFFGKELNNNTTITTNLSSNSKITLDTENYSKPVTNNNNWSSIK
jgi:hypothetical protein